MGHTDGYISNGEASIYYSAQDSVAIEIPFSGELDAIKKKKQELNEEFSHLLVSGFPHNFEACCVDNLGCPAAMHSTTGFSLDQSRFGAVLMTGVLKECIASPKQRLTSELH